MHCLILSSHHPSYCQCRLWNWGCRGLGLVPGDEGTTRKCPVCLPNPGTHPQAPWHRRQSDASGGDKGEVISRAVEQVSHQNNWLWVREKLKLRTGFRFGPDAPAMGPCSPGRYYGSDSTCPPRTSELHPDMITTSATQDFHPITGPCESPCPYQEATMGRQLNKLEGTESLHMFSLQQMWFCGKFSKLTSHFNLHVPRELKGNAHSHLGSQNVSVCYLSVPLSKPYRESTNKYFFKNTQMKAYVKTIIRWTNLTFPLDK